jgi:hypothetical protein
VSQVLRPGGAAALRQRRDAYALTRQIGEDLQDARAMMTADLPREAARTLGSTVAANDANPVAQKMIERQPEVMADARKVLASAEREARHQVTTSRTGEWLRSGDTETRLSIGRSEAGHHYMLEVATERGDHGGRWSRAFGSAEIAAAAGKAAQERALDSGMPRERSAQVVPIRAKAQQRGPQMAR